MKYIYFCRILLFKVILHLQLIQYFKKYAIYLYKLSNFANQFWPYFMAIMIWVENSSRWFILLSLCQHFSKTARKAEVLSFNKARLSDVWVIRFVGFLGKQLARNHFAGWGPSTGIMFNIGSSPLVNFMINNIKNFKPD